MAEFIDYTPIRYMGPGLAGKKYSDPWLEGTPILGPLLVSSRARKGLDELSKQPIPKYGASAELNAYYGQAANEAANPMGYTAAEKAAFEQDLSRSRQANTRNAINIGGGNIARTVAGMNTANELSARGRFVASDAGIKRMNRQAALSRLGSATMRLQALRDANTGADLNRRLMTEQAYGQAISDARYNQSNQIMSALTLGAGMPMGGGGGTGGGNPNVTPARLQNPAMTSDYNMYDPYSRLA